MPVETHCFRSRSGNGGSGVRTIVGSRGSGIAVVSVGGDRGSSDSGGGNLVDVGLDENLLVDVGLSGDLLMHVGLGGDLLMDVELGGDLLMHAGLGGDLLVDVGLGGDLGVDLRLSQRVGVSVDLVGMSVGQGSDGVAIVGEASGGGSS